MCKSIKRILKNIPENRRKNVLAIEQKHKEDLLKAFVQKAEELRKHGTVIVESPRQAAHLSDYYKNSGEEMFYATKLEISVTKRGIKTRVLNLLQDTSCRSARFFEPTVEPLDTVNFTQKETINVEGKKETFFKPVHYERFSKAFIHVVAVEGRPTLKLLDGRAIGRLNCRDEDTGKLQEHWILDLCDGEWYDLINEEILPIKGSAVDAGDGTYHKDILWYNVTKKDVVTSNSQIKDAEATFFCENHSFNSAEFMDGVTYGAVRQLAHLVNLGVISTKDLTLKMVAQISTRWAQWKASQAHMANVGVAAFYIGKMKNTEENYESHDGEYFLSNVFYASAVNKALVEAGLTYRDGTPKYYLLPDAVAGKHGQGRSWMIKGKFQVIHKWAMTRIMERFANKHYVFINRTLPKERLAVKQYLYDTAIHARDSWAAGLDALREELTDPAAVKEWEVLKALVEADEKAPHPWDKAVVVIRDDDCKVIADVDLFADLNALKTTFDLTRPSGVNLMMEGHTKHVANTNVQESQAPLACDPLWYKEYLERKMGENCEAIRQRFLEQEAQPAGIEDFTGKTGINSMKLLDKVFPQFKRDYYAPGYQSDVNNKLKGLVNDCARLRVGVEGEHEYASPDFAVALCNQRVLTIEEVKTSKGESKPVVGILCKDVKEGELAFITKEPMIGDKEYSIGKGISPAAYIQKAAENPAISDMDLWLLWYQVSHAESGSLMIAAYSVLNYLHAGYDNDGDHFIIFRDKELVEKLVEDYNFRATKILSDKDAEGIEIPVADDDAIKNAAEEFEKSKARIEGAAAAEE